MNHLPATVHRLVVFVIGAAAIVIGGGAIAWRLSVKPIKDWIERIDTGAAVRFADGAWWPAVLAAVLVVGLLVGLVLLGTATRPMKAERVLLPASSDVGRLTIQPGLIAAAAANELERSPVIAAAKGKAVNDRGQQIIQLTVQARSDRSYTDIAKACEGVTDTIDDALDGAPVFVQVLVQLNHPDLPKATAAA